MRSTFAVLTTVLSMALFALSLVLPAFAYQLDDGRSQDVLGLRAFATGWFPAISEIGSLVTGGGEAKYLPMLAWVANPLLFLAWLAAIDRRQLAAFGLAVASLVFGLVFLFAHTVPTVTGGSWPPHCRIGFVVWVLAIACAAVAGVGVDERVPRAPLSH